VEISADGRKLLDLDVPWAEEQPDGSESCLRTAAKVNFAPRLIVLGKPVTAKKLELRLVQVRKGTTFEDTAVSEWQPIFAGAPAPLGLEEARAALASLSVDPALPAGALLPWPKGEPGATYPDYTAFIEKRLAGAQLGPAKAFLAAYGPELRDHAVAVMGRRLLGDMSFTEGDGEWNELYPELLLDERGRIARLRAVFHKDGAPGCRHALPAEP